MLGSADEIKDVINKRVYQNFDTPSMIYQSIRCLLGVDGPDEVHGTPGEAGSEGGHHNLIALLETVLVFVKTQGD